MENIMNDTMKLINTFTTEAVNLANKTVEQYNKVREEYNKNQANLDENIIKKLTATIDEKDKKIMELEKRIQDQNAIIVAMKKEIENGSSSVKEKQKRIQLITNCDLWCSDNSKKYTLYRFDAREKEIIKYQDGLFEILLYKDDSELNQIVEYLNTIILIGTIDDIYVYGVITDWKDIISGSLNGLKDSFRKIEN